MNDDDLWSELPTTSEQSQKALAVASGWIGKEVQGVAIGATPEGDDCLVVYTLNGDAAAVQALPDECEGLPVRTEVGEPFQAGG